MKISHKFVSTNYSSCQKRLECVHYRPSVPAGAVFPAGRGGHRDLHLLPVLADQLGALPAGVHVVVAVAAAPVAVVAPDLAPEGVRVLGDVLVPGGGLVVRAALVVAHAGHLGAASLDALKKEKKRKMLELLQLDHHHHGETDQGSVALAVAVSAGVAPVRGAGGQAVAHFGAQVRGGVGGIADRRDAHLTWR